MQMVHACVVGRHPDDSSDENEDIAQAIEQVKTSDVRLARAGSLVEFLAAVAQLRNRYGLLDLLDVIDHGRPGVQMIGRDVLFASDADFCSPLRGQLSACAIAGHLSPFAHVRLLGCVVATDDDADATTPAAGRLVLYKTARALGERRTVFGTLRPTNSGDFADVGYLLPTLENEILFSSLAALDGDPPSHKVRRPALGWLRGERCP